MADANAGHDFDELDKRLTEANETGHRLHRASQRLHDAAYSLNYTQDRMGVDAKVVVESYVDNQISESDEFVDELNKLIGSARSAQRLQSGIDERAADALTRVVPTE